MNPSNQWHSKLALALAAGALLISTATAGGPAIAGALAGDSDSVDGFDAVKAGTPVKQRQGKLVATSKSNGRLPNNIIKKAPDAKRLAGKPVSYFVSAAVATALYETAAHAASTYQTKVEAAAAADRTLLAVNPAPMGAARAATGVSVGSLTFSTPAPGRLRVEMPAHARADCPSSVFADIWLTLDGAFLPGSAQRTTPSNSTLSSYLLVGVTASSVSAGEHTVTAVIGCTSGLTTTETTGSRSALVTVLGTGNTG